jgi:hypothetical protein
MQHFVHGPHVRYHLPNVFHPNQFLCRHLVTICWDFPFHVTPDTRRSVRRKTSLVKIWGQFYKSFWTLGQLYKLVLKCVNMLWLWNILSEFMKLDPRVSIQLVLVSEKWPFEYRTVRYSDVHCTCLTFHFFKHKSQRLIRLGPSLLSYKSSSHLFNQRNFFCVYSCLVWGAFQGHPAMRWEALTFRGTPTCLIITLWEKIM